MGAAREVDGEVKFRRRVVAVALHRHAVLERHRMLRRSADQGRACRLAIEHERPGGDVHVMGAPVGELAARVLIPPAKLVVAVRIRLRQLLLAVLVFRGRPLQKPEVGRRHLALPAVPVEPLRHRSRGNRRARRRRADRRLHPLDPAEPPFGDERHRGNEQIERTALLRAHLHDPAGLFLDLPDQLAFIDRERERLLAVDVFAGEHRLDDRLRVPVVRRGHVDHVDVLALQDRAIILVHRGFSARELLVEVRGTVRIHVGDRDDVDPVLGGPDVGLGDAAGADQAEGHAVILGLRFVGERPRRPVKIRHGRSGGSRGTCGEKTTPRVGHERTSSQNWVSESAE